VAEVEKLQVVFSSRIVNSGFMNTEPTDPVIRVRADQAISELDVPHKVLSILNNRYNVPFCDDTTAAYPQMHLPAGIYPNGGYRYLDASLIDAENNTIGHIRVYNESEREDIFKFSGALQAVQYFLHV
jgi:hypothetical protein